MHGYNAIWFLFVKCVLNLFCTITVKNVYEGSPSPDGTHDVPLVKLFMTANIFETGFPGIFQACRSIPGKEEFNK
jgi:hypothetical protein